MNINARKINQKKYIEIYGLLGNFELPGKKTKVRYFSTNVSSRDKKSDVYLLLKELKPMRERVKANELKNLDSLLQRNLNDYRVAEELIPYLLTSSSPIAFFPAILAVLIPNGFLSQENGIYPLPKTTVSENGNTLVSFDDSWKLEIFKIDDKDSNLGILSIDTNDIDVVVLDGQHRANAFRVVSNAFPDKDSSVYPAFYQSIQIPSEFNAELPVTIIWFENEEIEFDPRIVSRKLFVDVNMSAKKISKSRQILLDEYEISSLITRFFYSKLAGDKSFSAKEFSLLHSDFDRDSDIAASSSNSFSITNPQIVYDVFSWIVLGSRHYNKLNLYQISREHFKNNITQFDEIFGNDFPSSENIKEDDALNTRKIIVVDSKRNEIFEKEYNDNLHEVIYNIYNKFTLFNKHYQASEIIQSWYEGSHENIAPMNTYQRIAWKEIFSGGEGLYYTFRNKDIKPTPSINNYICAIDEIESELESIRAKYFPLNTLKEVNAAFISVKSKAFQIGLFMALDIFRESDKFIDKYEDFITKLNTIKLNNWIYIFNVIRPKLIRGTSPKDWPTYQKLILRIIQGSEQNYYTVDNYIDSPDYIIFEKDIEEAFNAWWKENEDDINEDLFMYKTIEEQIKTWATKTKESVEKLMRDGEIELILFDNHDAEKLASEIVIKLGKKINPSFA